MIPSRVEWLSSLLFFLGILHSFSVKIFAHWAKSFKKASPAYKTLHVLSEVEFVFGIWAFLLLVVFLFTEGGDWTLRFFERQNFNEALFVFVIMLLASTQPILQMAESLVFSCARLLPLPKGQAFFVSALVMGPLMGSLITEPAAMTVTVFLLSDQLFSKGLSSALKYSILGLLLVNVSIGGTLSHFAAPPVVMVARTWNWDFWYMISHFGWKALVSIIISTTFYASVFRKSLRGLVLEKVEQQKKLAPIWLRALHIFFLVSAVLAAHHGPVLIGILFFYVGLSSVTREFQGSPKFKEAFMVAFFLSGLVVLGAMQAWWLNPLLQRLQNHELYLGSIALTSVTDNAALTYLASLVSNLSEQARYAIVAGSVVGGGLTIIANAPNPIAFGLLGKYFGPEGISPLQVFLKGLVPTVIAGLCFWLLG